MRQDKGDERTTTQRIVEAVEDILRLIQAGEFR